MKLKRNHIPKVNISNASPDLLSGWLLNANFTFRHILESNDDDSEEIQSKRTKVDCILGVKKEGNEVVAVVRFEDGHYDLVSTRVLVSKCPKVIFT